MNLSYQVKQFNLHNLKGISDKTLEMHFKLYEGYVKQSNLLNEMLSEQSHKKEKTPEDLAISSELKRHLGFEYNGMILHEYYFENLKKDGEGEAKKDSLFFRETERSFGSYENWKKDFINVGQMRGVGWAICYRDPGTQALSNFWVSLHENGNLAGFKPILVMDVWEHAFLLDYSPSEKAQYIESFFANLNWDSVEKRMVS